MSKFDWNKLRAKVKPLFDEAGIRFCELQLPRCTLGFNPTFAHSKKVRHWNTIEDALEVILACQTCHQYIEALGQKKVVTMTEVVQKIIANRMVTIDYGQIIEEHFRANR